MLHYQQIEHLGNTDLKVSKFEKWEKRIVNDKMFGPKFHALKVRNYKSVNIYEEEHLIIYTLVNFFFLPFMFYVGY